MYDKERVEYLLQQPKTEANINELIELNVGLVRKQLIKFGFQYDTDALCVGYEALYKAIITFKPSKGHKFSTYATVCIYNRLGSYLRSLNTEIIKCTVSYDAPLSEDLVLLDTLHSTLSADGQIVEESSISYIKETVAICLSTVTNTTKKSILELWIKSEFLMSHTDIAEALNYSQSYVSQVIRNFRKELKQKLEEN